MPLHLGLHFHRETPCVLVYFPSSRVSLVHAHLLLVHRLLRERRWLPRGFLPRGSERRWSPSSGSYKTRTVGAAASSRLHQGPVERPGLGGLGGLASDALDHFNYQQLCKCTGLCLGELVCVEVR